MQKAHDAVQAVMIGQRQGRHLQLGCSPEKTIGRRCPVEKAEITVRVKVDHQS
jgi:hypothetical protein